jgi:hypothetical protein
VMHYEKLLIYAVYIHCFFWSSLLHRNCNICVHNNVNKCFPFFLPFFPFFLSNL